MSPSSHRSPARRALVAAGLAAGLTAAVLAVPATASAAPGETPPDPLGGVVTTLEEALTGQGGGATPPAPPGAGALPLPGAPGEPVEPAAEAPAEEGPAEEGPVPPPPPELVAGLQAALTPLGVPAHCVEGVADGVRHLVNGVLSQEPVEAVEDLVAGLRGALTGLASGQPPAPDPAVLGGEEVAADIEALLAAFQACLPALPEPEAPAPAPAVPAPAPVAAPVAAPAAEHPVRYLGYAPTGGTGAAGTDDAGTVPLALLGGGLLVAGAAGAAVSRARSRAVGR